MTIAGVVVAFPPNPGTAANEDWAELAPPYHGDPDVDRLIERAFVLGLRSAIGDDLVGHRRRLVAATEKVALRLRS